MKDCQSEEEFCDVLRNILVGYPQTEGTLLGNFLLYQKIIKQRLIFDEMMCAKLCSVVYPQMMKIMLVNSVHRHIQQKNIREGNCYFPDTILKQFRYCFIDYECTHHNLGTQIKSMYKLVLVTKVYFKL